MSDENQTVETTLLDVDISEVAADVSGVEQLTNDGDAETTPCVCEILAAD